MNSKPEINSKAYKVHGKISDNKMDNKNGFI